MKKIFIIFLALQCYANAQLELELHKPNLWEAIVWSSSSGISLGAHESRTFNYTNTAWLPGFIEDWYNYKVNTDAVFGKIFTWQKIFRDLDYATDRKAWESWKLVCNVKKVVSWQFLEAFVFHWAIKNTFATLIRDKFKHGQFFYSFDFSLITFIEF